MVPFELIPSTDLSHLNFFLHDKVLVIGDKVMIPRFDGTGTRLLFQVTGVTPNDIVIVTEEKLSQISTQVHFVQKELDTLP